MKYIDEFRNNKVITALINEINHTLATVDSQITLMEVCGTHTMAISRYGIRNILPEKKIRLISGPGCPVCVTSNEYIDKSIKYAQQKDVIITTFGDMYRVPGSNRISLEKLKLKSSSPVDIRIVYSPLESLSIAESNKNKTVIFLSVGFETTTPAIAATVMEAKSRKLANWFILAGNKTIPNAMKLLLDTNEIDISGFICPGHVSTIIGSAPYNFIAKKYKIPCVITGFEPVDILEGILMLLNQITSSVPKIEIQYHRSVKPEGNKKAVKIMNTVFKKTDSLWRGIGNIPGTGMKLTEKYSQFNIETCMPVQLPKTTPEQNKGCICGEILRGVKLPNQCRLFRKTCTPENPVGGCMVSSEGTCAAYFKYS